MLAACQPTAAKDNGTSPSHLQLSCSTIERTGARTQASEPTRRSRAPLRASHAQGLLIAALVALVPVQRPPTVRDVYVSEDYRRPGLRLRDDGTGQLLGAPTSAARRRRGNDLDARRQVLLRDQLQHRVVYQLLNVGADGALTPLPLASAALRPPNSASRSPPDGKYLYIAGLPGRPIRGFSIGADGGLTFVARHSYTTTVSPQPRRIISSPDSKSIYTVDYSQSELHAVHDRLDGVADRRRPDRPRPTPGDEPYSVTITPDGKQVYIGQRHRQASPGYNVAADGTHAEMSGLPVRDRHAPYAGMTVSPDGTQLFVTTYEPTTSRRDVDRSRRRA